TPGIKTALCFGKWCSETLMQDREREKLRVGSSSKRGGFQKRERSSDRPRSWKSEEGGRERAGWSWHSLLPC
ncbi:hypothetical protein P5F43_16355, partial [Clostridium perfringens]|nr:hypothetical protein [Clostridium perfringens]